MSPERSTDELLLAELADALRPADREIDPDRVLALRQAVESSPSEDRSNETPARRGSLGLREWLAASPGLAVAAAGALVAIALGVGVLIGGSGGSDEGGGAAIATGEVEYDGTIKLGDATGTLSVVNAGIGREIHLDTNDLPILPTGEYYEVWFVGPDDSPRHPDRISAGTFHPNKDGESEITLTAAVNPSLYPQVVVTAESGNGDPSSGGITVLRADVG